MSRANGSQVTGACKFWNAVKGYGFITCDDGGADLFVSQHDLVTGDGGFRALVAGSRVECTYTIDKGKAIGKNITGPGGQVLRSFKDMYTAKREIEAAKPPDPNKLYGTIKWFNQPKSFGFIIPQAGGDDLFFHFSECLKGIVPAEGDQVEYITKVDNNGKTVGGQVKNKTQKSAKPKNAPYNAPNPAATPTYAAPNMYAAAPGGYGRKTGIVKFFDEGKGYGFIVPDTGGRDIHVHKSNVMGGELVKDDAVEYDEQNQNGKVQAVMVSRSQGGKRAGAENAAYATKRPRVMYEMPPAAIAQPYGQEYQYFDQNAAAAGAPRYY